MKKPDRPPGQKKQASADRADEPVKKGNAGKTPGAFKNLRSSVSTNARNKLTALRTDRTPQHASKGKASASSEFAAGGASIGLSAGAQVTELRRPAQRPGARPSFEQSITMADYLRARRGFSSDSQMAELLGVHRSRLVAWKQGADVPNAENGHLLAYLAVVVQELGQFLDPDVIPDWLLTEQHALGGRTAVQALQEGSLADVLQAVNATEHGAYM
ncbi:MAG: hypothetical protein JWM27_2957 [Gemmatimonadetes bacterium]|nr:hypothetical protein [Gemmatimonadota bacterium]